MDDDGKEKTFRQMASEAPGKQVLAYVKHRASADGTVEARVGCLTTTRPCESRVRATLENTDPISIVLICGGNAETDLRILVVGQFVDKFGQVRSAGRLITVVALASSMTC